VIASLLIRAEIPLEEVREEKNPEDGKHNEKLHQNDSPKFPAPGHAPESVVVKSEYFYEHVE
jgi:hypothetical protein